jgi:hypothetical protein
MEGPQQILNTRQGAVAARWHSPGTDLLLPLLLLGLIARFLRNLLRGKCQHQTLLSSAFDFRPSAWVFRQPKAASRKPN